MGGKYRSKFKVQGSKFQTVQGTRASGSKSPHLHFAVAEGRFREKPLVRNSKEPLPARPCRRSCKEVMKRNMIGILPLIVGGGLVLSGCASSHHELTPTGPPDATVQTTRTVVVTQQPSPPPLVVTEEPPPPRTEVVGPPPGQTQVWIAGYWSFTDARWVWMPGHWEVRPRPSAIWVPGHWDANPEGKGWVWTQGYWE